MHHLGGPSLIGPQRRFLFRVMIVRRQSAPRLYHLLSGRFASVQGVMVQGVVVRGTVIGSGP